MKLHYAASLTIVLQLSQQSLSQFHPPMPYGAMGMAPMPMPMGPMQMGPMPMPMPMMPQQKMPVVVMPYHSKTADSFRQPRRKRLKKRYRESESESGSDDSDEADDSRSGDMEFRAATRTKRRQVLTPVVSYVTKDGYVVYQKKIKKERAKDWLSLGKRSQPEDKKQSEEMTLRQLKQKFRNAKKSSHRHHELRSR